MRFAVMKFHVWLIAACAILNCGGGNAQSTPPNELPPPNIVFIMLDDLGYGELQWYPDEENIAARNATPGDTFYTPSIFELAREGVRFTNYHSPAPVCSPARAAILTGRFPQEFNMGDILSDVSGQGLPVGTPTIATFLRDSGGYATSHVGKWHIGNAYPRYMPVNFGFDESWVRFGSELVAPYKGNVFIQNDDIAGKSVLAPEEHSAETITRLGIEFIEAAESADQPYFLNVWYRAPHYVLDPPANFPGVVPGAYNPQPFSTWPQTWSALVADIPELASLAYLQNHSLTANAKQRAMYIATVAWVDYQIGQLVKRINELDPDGNTLVVVTSDNGAAAKAFASSGGSIPGFWQPNASLRGEKQTMYEGGIKVPMIARWPAAQLVEGSRIDDLTVGYDFMPTFLAAAGIDAAPANFVGLNLLDRLQGQGTLPPRPELLVWERKNFDGGWGGTDLNSTPADEQYKYAVVDQSQARKLVIDRGAATTVTPGLFDLNNTNASGVNEAQVYNLANAEPATLAALEGDYREWRGKVGAIPVEYNLQNTTAEISDACLDFDAPGDVVELNQNEDLWFRAGDFSFQARLDLESLPASGDAVVVEHPGSWTLQVSSGPSPNSVRGSLDIHGKTGTSGYPGTPAAAPLTLSGTTACVLPCTVSIAFTVLGVASGDSTVRLYLNNQAVAEYAGNTKDNIDLKEIYANESAAVILGNDAAGESGLSGKIIDPRFYRLYLTPAEVSAVWQEQSAEVCESGSCH